MDARTTRRLAATGGSLAALALAATATAVPASATQVAEPDSFTSAFVVDAVGSNVVDAEGNPAPGDPDATGEFMFRVNADEDVICYDITLDGVEPPYESPARTATHIHAAPAGEGGPPRIAFPNPEGDGDVLTSSGCLQGPFTTGIEGPDGNDTGEGFTLAQLEEDPASFSADTHTAEYVPGAVRGQLVRVPVGGADTGAGAVADGGSAALVAGGVAVAAAGAAGVVLLRRRGAQQG
ncbi:CHRD domain-containing protein [Pseudokineococcus lusitanus]|uniref:CHRD domain-containing protein n=1 Tax=Pseudokineococcus lusitanus TaxID=763993 RepID=A0A3N1HR59_9ACTN|nr:CHRD domain-containing protein [Pseudokineococcus lusitanus]ROP45004.1 CHRD domain-containing protein [Pseudokineococcus lusitanus]